MLNASYAVKRGVAADFIPDYENFQETSANPQPLSPEFCFHFSTVVKDQVINNCGTFAYLTKRY